MPPRTAGGAAGLQELRPFCVLGLHHFFFAPVRRACPQLVILRVWCWWCVVAVVALLVRRRFFLFFCGLPPQKKKRKKPPRPAAGVCHLARSVCVFCFLFVCFLLAFRFPSLPPRALPPCWRQSPPTSARFPSLLPHLPPCWGKKQKAFLFLAAGFLFLPRLPRWWHSF